MIRLTLGVAALLLLLAACSTSGDLLEKWSEDGQVADSDSLNSPEFKELNDSLSVLGYQGIGMRYETSGVLRMLTTVFKDPRVSGRKIKLVYTGLALSYDSKQDSLTIGGPSDASQIISYIEKNIPKSKK